MKKKAAAWILCALLLICALPFSVLAEAATDAPSGDRRVTLGADLTLEQRDQIYKDFSLTPGDVRELTVTNKEERTYLEGLVSERKIGSRALSCSFITILPEGSGLDVTLHNINYCTEAMYKNALATAGITDAKVLISAPFPVSGTGALTGIYKAYEDMTGVSLNDLAKKLGAEELVLTGELSEYIGSEQAAGLLSELKQILDNTAQMSDAEVLEEIKKIAAAYNVDLSDAMYKQVLSLCRKLEGLNEEQLQKELTSLSQKAQKAGQAVKTVQRVYESVKTFFEQAGEFFSNLFSGWWR